FVTAAKKARNLHSVNFDQLYAFLKHNERAAKEVLEMQLSKDLDERNDRLWMLDGGNMIKSLLDAVGITAAQDCVNTAQCAAWELQ
nr:hypothetical protein [Tanacetum cinerariifolium]